MGILLINNDLYNSSKIVSFKKQTNAAELSRATPKTSKKRQGHFDGIILCREIGRKERNKNKDLKREGEIRMMRTS